MVLPVFSLNLVCVCLCGGAGVAYKFRLPLCTQNDTVAFPAGFNPAAQDLIHRLLCKDPAARITLDDVKVGACWVALAATVGLLPPLDRQRFGQRCTCPGAPVPTTWHWVHAVLAASQAPHPSHGGGVRERHYTIVQDGLYVGELRSFALSVCGRAR